MEGLVVEDMAPSNRQVPARLGLAAKPIRCSAAPLLTTRFALGAIDECAVGRDLCRRVVGV